MSQSARPRTFSPVPTVLALDSDGKLLYGKPAQEAGRGGKPTISNFKVRLGEFQGEEQYKSRARRRLAGKTKPLVLANDRENIRTFTYIEAATEFLKNIISKKEDDDLPETLVVGVPSLREDDFERYYKSNITKALTSLGYNEPTFLWEPFAVFQYYRHVEKSIATTGERQSVMVLDLGAGTFDCVVVQTTKDGNLSAGGVRSSPLGFMSRSGGGSAVNVALVKLIQVKAEEQGLKFRDNAIDRVESSCGKWIVEDAKIDLSNLINRNESLKDAGLEDFKREQILGSITTHLTFPAGTLHADKDVDAVVTAAEFREIIHRLWDNDWGDMILECHRKAEQHYQQQIQKYDAVIVGGGSAQLPFLKAHIKRTLVGLVDDSQIIIGDGKGCEVAYGLAVEAKEQSTRDSRLVNDRISGWLESNLYIRLGADSKNRWQRPHVKESNSVWKNNKGLVYEALSILDRDDQGRTVTAKFELPKPIRNVLHYEFFDSESCEGAPLNISSRLLKLPKDARLKDWKSIELDLDISMDGQVTPRFKLVRSGKIRAEIAGQTFSLEARTVEGKGYIGVDFGSANTYITEYLTPQEEPEEFIYPVYTVGDRATLSRLRDLELNIREQREAGWLTEDMLHQFSRNKRYYFVFHNNNIEGSLLSIGQTVSAINGTLEHQPSKEDIEARNLAEAFDWVLEHPDAYLGNTEKYSGGDFSAFIRHLNRMLRMGANNKGEADDEIGAFRQPKHESKAPVHTFLADGSRHDYPPAKFVPPFIEKLGQELIDERANTSGLELAVRAHNKFVEIHPFVDGNGRTARLLMMAILTDHQLPIIDLRPDDKRRYLDALERSNNKDLGPMLNLFADLMEVSLAEIQDWTETEITGAIEGKTAVEAKEEAANDTIHGSDTEVQGQVVPAWEDVGSAHGNHGGSATKLDTSDRGPKEKERSFRDRLLEVRRKNKLLVDPISDVYSSWSPAFLALKTEIENRVAKLDAEAETIGAQIRFQKYDELSEAGFSSLCRRHSGSRLMTSWFSSITVHEGYDYSRIMFVFGSTSDELRELRPTVAPVSCWVTIGGEKTGQWRPLKDEPISLREVGYEPGSAVFRSANNEMIQESLDKIVENLVSEMYEFVQTQ